MWRRIETQARRLCALSMEKRVDYSRSANDQSEKWRPDKDICETYLWCSDGIWSVRGHPHDGHKTEKKIRLLDIPDRDSGELHSHQQHKDPQHRMRLLPGPSRRY